MGAVCQHARVASHWGWAQVLAARQQSPAADIRAKCACPADEEEEDSEEEEEERPATRRRTAAGAAPGHRRGGPTGRGRGRRAAASPADSEGSEEETEEGSEEEGEDVEDSKPARPAPKRPRGAAGALKPMPVRPATRVPDVIKATRVSEPGSCRRGSDAALWGASKQGCRSNRLLLHEPLPVSCPPIAGEVPDSRAAGHCNTADSHSPSLCPRPHAACRLGACPAPRAPRSGASLLRTDRWRWWSVTSRRGR